MLITAQPACSDWADSTKWKEYNQDDTYDLDITKQTNTVYVLYQDEVGNLSECKSESIDYKVIGAGTRNC
jgi:hypothetical protein